MPWHPTLNAALNLTSATLLVLGYRAIRGGREAAHKRFMLAAFGANKANGLRQNLINVLGVIRPVGGNIQCAVTVETAVNQRKEVRLHDPALVMAFFWPRVREVEVDAA